MDIINYVFFLVIILSICFIYKYIGQKSLNSTLNLSISDGFVIFLAIQQILAFPILHTHRSFMSFFILFILSIVISILICLVFFLLKKKNKAVLEIIITKKEKSYMSSKIFIGVFFLLVFAQIIGSLATEKYDYDDSFYVNLMQQNIGELHLYSYDPSTGNKDFPMLPFYVLQSWELIVSTFSYITNIPVVILAHTLLPIIIVILSYIAYTKLFTELAGEKNKKYIYLMLIFLAIFHIMNGFSPYSQGHFLLGRAWQGKAVLLHLILPTLYTYLLRYINKPNKVTLFYISIINIAAFGLNPSSLYLCTFTIGIFFLISLLLKTCSRKQSFYLIVSFLPIVFFSIFIFRNVNNFVKTWPDTQEEAFHYFIIVKNFLGDGLYLPIYIILLPILFYVLKGKEKQFLFWFPSLILVLIANPLIAPFIAKHFTSVATYWRILWLFPTGVAASYLGVQLVIFLTKKIRANKIGYTKSVAISIVITLIPLIVCGKYIFTNQNRFHTANNIYKIPEDIVTIGENLISKGKTKVLASDEGAVYLRSIATNLEIVFTRDHYMVGFLGLESEEYRKRRELYDIVNGNITDYKNLKSLISEFGIEWVVFPKSNQSLVEYFNASTEFLRYDSKTKDTIVFHAIQSIER